MLAINLFHEQQRIEFERKYDPVRMAIIGIIFGLIILGLVTAWMYLDYRPTRESVATLFTDLKRNEKQFKDAEVQLKVLPQQENEFKLLKKRAEEKGLKSRVLEIFKDSMPTNLYVTKLSVVRKTDTKQEPIEKDKKGRQKFKTLYISYSLLNFEGNYIEATKPKALETRDSLLDLFKKSETLREIAARATAGNTNENKVALLANFVATDPTAIEPSKATIAFDMELKR